MYFVEWWSLVTRVSTTIRNGKIFSFSLLVIEEFILIENFCIYKKWIENTIL